MLFAGMRAQCGRWGGRIPSLAISSPPAATIVPSSYGKKLTTLPPLSPSLTPQEPRLGSKSTLITLTTSPVRNLGGFLACFIDCSLVAGYYCLLYSYLCLSLAVLSEFPGVGASRVWLGVGVWLVGRDGVGDHVAGDGRECDGPFECVGCKALLRSSPGRECRLLGPCSIRQSPLRLDFAFGSPRPLWRRPRQPLCPSRHRRM